MSFYSPHLMLLKISLKVSQKHGENICRSVALKILVSEEERNYVETSKVRRNTITKHKFDII